MYMNLQNMNYLPMYPRTTESRNQHVFKVAPASGGVDCCQRWNSHQINRRHQKLAVGAEQRNVVFQPVWVMQSANQRLNTPNNVIQFNGIQMMTVDQTANWIRWLCLQLGWRQTEEYEMSFRENNIDGIMLIHLNHEILRFDMGICNHFHRLDLLAVIRQFFPFLNFNRGFNEPMRLSDLRNFDTNYSNGAKIAITRMQDSPSANDKPSFLKTPVSDKDDSLGLDSNSLQNISLKSVSTKSDCNMEFDEGKSQRSPTRKQLLKIEELEIKGIWSNSSLRHKDRVEKAAPSRKSFEDIQELRSGKSHDANDSYAVQKESTTREVRAKLILTDSSLNFVGIQNIRDRFMKFNFVVTIEQVGHYCCVLTFRSRVEAMTALTYQHQIGFNLDPYEEDRCRMRMSPVANHGHSYDASSPDKSFSRSVKNTSEALVSTCTKCKAQEICACKLRNDCRASEIVGWVSLESEEGRSSFQKLSSCE